jgi:adenylate cyclase
MPEVHAEGGCRDKRIIEIGIGINTGDMAVGNIRAEGKNLDYTVVGVKVNPGAPLESLTRGYNNHIIISDIAYNNEYHCGERTRLRNRHGETAAN